jgi:hypothetical protein
MLDETTFSPLSQTHKILLTKPRAEEMLAMQSTFFNLIYILIALHCVFIGVALGEVEVCFSLILMLLNTIDKHCELNNEHKVTERVYSEWTASGPCSTL